MLFNQTNKTSLAVIGSTTASFLCASLLSSIINVSPVSAYTASITTSNNISLDVSPSGDGTNIHSESINVTSDCRAGYNLTIATPSGSDLYQYVNNTASNTASFTAVDGTSALSSSNNTNKWGYTLTSNPTSSTVFSPLSSTSSTLKTPSETADPDNNINDTFNINYGIKVDNTIAPGTYQMADDGNGNAGSIVYYLTMDTTCTQYTVSFNPNGGTGTMDTQYIEAGEATNLSSNSFTSPALGTSYTDAGNNTIQGTSTTYWRFNGWNTAIDGTGTSYTNNESVTDLAAAGSSITLYAQWEAVPVLVVNYEGNGMEFDGGATENKMGYLNTCETKYVSSSSYSHTANINDDGTQIDSTKYDNNLATKDVITIPGADSLHVTIKYGTENNWDMLYVFEGEYTGNVSRNMNAGQLAKYMGGNNTVTTVELDIPGDTATFAFFSDGSGQYWGYHASVVGYYDEEPTSYASTTQVCGRTLVSGEYQTPAPDDDRLFQGWSETSSSTTPEYTTADSVLANLSGNNGEIKTLYAIWTPRYHINYVNNCMSYASANSACTQSVSDSTSTQTVNLNASGNGSGTLTNYNNNNTWNLTGWKIAGWNTAADGIGTEYAPSSTYQITGASVGDSITLYARWAPVYTIQYDGNNADNPNGMGTTDQSTGVKSVKQTNVGEGDPVDLLASNFKRAGYGFVGWSTDSDAWAHFTDNNNSNDPTIYGPNETISAPAYPNNGTNITTLYAVWVPAKKDGNNNPVYLQDFSASDCGALTSTTFNSTTGEITANKNSIVALTDKRDNQIYTIARLADSKCWMIDNLRLDNQYTMGQNQNDNSVTNQSLTQGYGGTPGTYGSFVGLASSETTNFKNTTNSNTVYKSSLASPTDTYDGNGTLEDIGTSNYPGARIPRYNRSNTYNMVSNPSYTQDFANANSPTVSGTYKDANLYSYGNYYNYAAAMASTNANGNVSNSETAGTSICPSGWHLPSSYGTTKEFGSLSRSYGGTGNNQSGSSSGDIMSSRIRTFPNNFLYSGDYLSYSSPSGRGVRGSYWSRTGYSYYGAYDLNIIHANLDPTSDSSKYDGDTVRCLIDPSMVEITLDFNDGTGTVSRVYGVPGNSISLLSSSKPNYRFDGWNTAANGSGTNYTSSYSIPSGSNGITLYAQWTALYSVQYDGNGADNLNGMGTTDSTTGVKSVKQINVTSSTDITLLASNFKRTGYSFAGWSTDPNAWTHFTDNDNTNNPVIYGPMETITAPTSSAQGSIITLYAVWVPAEKDGSNNPIYLQDFSSDDCDNLTAATFDSATGTITAGSVVALTDKRDNEIYTIAKLADGKCWMVENLRLNNQYTMGQNQNDDSITNQSLSQGYGGETGTYGNFVGLADSESTNFGRGPNNIYKSSDDPPIDTYNPLNNTLEDIGTSNYPEYRFPSFNNDNTNSIIDSITYTQDYANASSPNDSGTNYRTGSNIYSYGNYYSWAAAMATTRYYSASSTSEVADTSICPSGWHLPSGDGTEKDYGLLSQGYGGTGGDQTGASASGDIMSNRFRAFPNNYLYSGLFLLSSNQDRGTYGYYWSRSAGNYSQSFFLKLASNTLSSSIARTKDYGFSVRCIFDGSYTIQYDGNGADNPNGMGTTSASGRKTVKQNGITEDITVKLLPGNFKRAGYGFVGWSTDSSAWAHFTDNDNTNDPIIYGPIEDVIIDGNLISKSNDQYIITLYAVWVPAKTSGGNPVYLQDFGTQQCNTLTKTDFNSVTGEITVNKNSVVALTDKRDNQVYAVAKLADNHCWMIENLRLEHEGTVGNNINDSSVTNQSLSQGYGGTAGTYGTFVGLADSETEDTYTSYSVASNSIYKSSDNPPIDTYDPLNNTLEDIGTTASPYNRFPRYNSDNSNNTADSMIYTQKYTNDGNSSSVGVDYKASRLYSYGNYYSWPAAMANTNHFNSLSASESAGTSICPSGWVLPTGSNSSSDFGLLSQGYGGTGDSQEGDINAGGIMSNRFRSFPNNFLYSDVVISYRGRYGSYWTRSMYGNDNTYSFHISSTQLIPSSHSFKFRLNNIRCLVGS